MTPIDFTSELAPLIWTVEGLMLVAVAWLVGMFFTEQARAHDFHWLEQRGVSDAAPTVPAAGTEPASDDDRRMAA
jgi:hypothetical protein